MLNKLKYGGGGVSIRSLFAFSLDDEVSCLLDAILATGTGSMNTWTFCESLAKEFEAVKTATDKHFEIIHSPHGDVMMYTYKIRPKTTKTTRIINK